MREQNSYGEYQPKQSEAVIGRPISMLKSGQSSPCRRDPRSDICYAHRLRLSMWI